jgi:hypothetical protein
VPCWQRTCGRCAPINRESGTHKMRIPPAAASNRVPSEWLVEHVPSVDDGFARAQFSKNCASNEEILAIFSGDGNPLDVRQQRFLSLLRPAVRWRVKTVTCAGLDSRRRGPMKSTRLCLACSNAFVPLRRAPRQRHCSSKACQRARRRDWRQNQLLNDSDCLNLFRHRRIWP